ncbi:hypothetical protein AA313_de0202977 [Arthrobotrys entomopaga]|nr:hypothetical protein AA313_de0202977 [Arthrobotrys entomopaga]
MSSSKNQVDSLTRSFSDFLNFATNHINRWKIDVEKLAQAQSELVASLDAEMKQDVDNIRQELEIKAQVHQQEIDLLNREIEYQQELVQKAKNKTSDLVKEKEVTIKALKADLVKKESLISKLNLQLKEIQMTLTPQGSNELSRTRKQLAESRHDAEKYKNLMELAKAAYSELVDEIMKHQNENSSLRSKLSKYEKEITVLRFQIREFDADETCPPNLRDEVLSLKAEISKLQLEKQDFAEKFHNLERKTSRTLHKKSLNSEVMRNTIQNLEADKLRWERAANAQFKLKNEQNQTNEYPGDTADQPTHLHFRPKENKGPRLRADASTFHPSKTTSGVSEAEDGVWTTDEVERRLCG